MITPLTSEEALASRPIGIFDSGVGGLTVLREMARQLPHESLIYFGDSLRCPYGPRSLSEIRHFAFQIAVWLVNLGVKLIVIACNSATAAALDTLQRSLPVPVIGVIEPGARAAVKATVSRRVGVIGTRATIESDVYPEAIRRLDSGITVFSAATPRFVEIVEQGLRLDRNPLESFMAPVSSIYVRPAFQEIARDYLEPLRRCAVDALVLGCTHYPLIAPLISSIMGSRIQIISSAAETAADVGSTLERRGQLAAPGQQATYRFASTAAETGDFQSLGAAILGRPLGEVESVSPRALEDGLARFGQGAGDGRPAYLDAQYLRRSPDGLRLSSPDADADACPGLEAGAWPEEEQVS
ncbi:MAG: glutamate racemase [Coriobacteriia bacterium]|nr:glutamate racemase [Coriobacteriia bacterium]